MIIGLTGRNASGKGEAANYLKEMGFLYFSLSDEIREELLTRGQEISRKNLIETGLCLRKTCGFDILAQRVLKKISMSENYIVDSFRNPAEVEYFRKVKNFYLILVQADEKVRFERIKNRRRENDPETFEDFIKYEQKELISSDPANQQILETEKMADFTAENNSTREHLHEQIRNILKEISKRLVRPGWDEYFMQIADVVAMRANCLKRRVAAIVVKDKRIIATGYNGTPKGVKNCTDGGCPRCGEFSSSGTRLSECFCSHAEENAIVQAAYHGVSVRSATIYTTFSPCLICTKMIINSGIEEVVYKSKYLMGEDSIRLLKEAGLKVRQV
jgi:dCMP deaminase